MTDWSEWVHAIFGARGQWLPGDPCGFRDHDHRVHSSGDYRAPPPADEHAGLHAYAKDVVGRRVMFSPAHRNALAVCIGDYLSQLQRPARIIAVSATHAHVLFFCGREDAKSIIASAKRCTSQRTRAFMPGSIWAQGCHVVRVQDESHYKAIVEYIIAHREQGAAIWEHPRTRTTSPE